MTTPPDRFSDSGQDPRSEQGPPADSSPAREDPDREWLNGCEFFEAVAAELALGSLTGSDRSAALAHLDTCDGCPALLKDLSTAADALLLLAPEADPPAGFEVRLLARLERAGAPVAAVPTSVAAAAPRQVAIVPLRRRARAALAAAAVVIAGAGIGVGIAVRPQHSTPSASGPIRLATLRSGVAYRSGEVAVGEVAVTGGNPSWIVMTFQKAGWSGKVYCVVTDHGHAEQVGSFWLHDGTGSWALRLPSSGDTVTSAEVRGPNGSVFATADFSA